jgi:putative hemolysin
MKKIITAVAMVVSITGCSSKSDVEPQRNSAIYGQVLSFSNNAPIGDATVVSSKCVQPDYLIGCTRWEDKTLMTSGDGSFSIQKGYESEMSVYKNGYWDFRIWNNDSYGRPGEVQYISSTGGLEKIVIKLFERVRINVHVKNTSAIADSVAFFAEGIHANKFKAKPVLLRKGIDTTFSYDAFGSLNNRIKVVSGYADYYYPGYIAVDSILYSKDVFISSGNNITLDINY